MIKSDFKLCIDEYIKDYLSLNPEAEASEMFYIYLASRILKANSIAFAGIGEAERLIREYAAGNERSELLNNIADGMQYIKKYLER